MKFTILCFALIASAWAAYAAPVAFSSSNTAGYRNTFKGLRDCKLMSSATKKVCGLKKLVLGNKYSFDFWRPELCEEVGCKCLPVADTVYAANHIGNSTRVIISHYIEFECA